MSETPFVQGFIDGRSKSVFLQGDDADRFREEAFDDDGWLIEGSVAGMPRLHCLLQEYLPVMQSDACEPPREQERPET